MDAARAFVQASRNYESSGRPANRNNSQCGCNPSIADNADNRSQPQSENRNRTIDELSTVLASLATLEFTALEGLTVLKLL
jgi:hypothetical protein